jgi:phosphate-induced protein 1
MILLGAVLFAVSALGQGLSALKIVPMNDFSPIFNKGGWIIDGKPVHVYLIWYGNWTGHPALTTVPAFINGLNQSSYTNILTTYWGRDAQVGGALGNSSNQVTLGGQRFDWYSRGSHLDDTGAKAVMTDSLSVFGVDPYAVYFIFTSADVRQTQGDQEQCIDYCGYHSDTFRSNQDIKYAVVGDPNRCGGGCSFANTAADSMTVSVSHELGEALTDPRPGDTWVDAHGNEMADKCHDTVGTIALPTGVFSVQALWVNVNSGFCDFSYFGTPVPPPGGGPPPPDPIDPPPDPCVGPNCINQNSVPLEPGRAPVPGRVDRQHNN